MGEKLEKHVRKQQWKDGKKVGKRWRKNRKKGGQRVLKLNVPVDRCSVSGFFDMFLPRKSSLSMVKPMPIARWLGQAQTIANVTLALEADLDPWQPPTDRGQGITASTEQPGEQRTRLDGVYLQILGFEII